MESFQKLDVCNDSVSSKNLEALYIRNRVNLNQTTKLEVQFALNPLN